MSSENTQDGPVSGFEPPWYFATEESNLKEEKTLHIEIEGKNLLLVKTEGLINALSNVCPHARCPMDRGRLEDFTLICICHGRRFDVRTGECLNDSLKLRVYEWKIEDGKIGVKIE